MLSSIVTAIITISTVHCNDVIIKVFAWIQVSFDGTINIIVLVLEGQFSFALPVYNKLFGKTDT